MQNVVFEQLDTALDTQLRREGWSLHQRLEAAVATTDDRQPNVPLESWRQLVAPAQPANFDKRLAWDGLNPSSAAWALNPPDATIPQNPDWWPLLMALRQAGRDAAV